MAIQVVCPGCHARFKVSDQHAGKKGPCPKCKVEITVPPSEDEVVIKAPDEFGGTRDAAGKLVLKPVVRDETVLTPLLFTGILLSVAVVLAVALYTRMTYPDGDIPTLLKTLGAIASAPPLAFAAYTILRDNELEPYRGVHLALRLTICAVIYSLLWGAYALAGPFFFGDQPLEPWSILFLVLPFVFVGTLTALVSLDLNPTNAFLHYALYLTVTIVLRLIVKLPAF